MSAEQRSNKSPENRESFGRRFLRMAGIFALIGIGVDFISDSIFGNK